MALGRKAAVSGRGLCAPAIAAVAAATPVPRKFRLVSDACEVMSLLETFRRAAHFSIRGVAKSCQRGRRGLEYAPFRSSRRPFGSAEKALRRTRDLLLIKVTVG